MHWTDRLSVDAEAADSLRRTLRPVGTLLVDHDTLSPGVHDMQCVAEVLTYTKPHHTCILNNYHNYGYCSSLYLCLKHDVSETGFCLRLLLETETSSIYWDQLSS
jgi:hypothetical protein